VFSATKAVGVAVESDAQIAMMFAHLRLQVDHVIGLDWTCRVVRKASIELEVERHEIAR
jgi:hypothetical protein